MNPPIGSPNKPQQSDNTAALVIGIGPDGLEINVMFMDNSIWTMTIPWSQFTAMLQDAIHGL